MRHHLSFLNAQGEEVIVHCPESRSAAATQYPVRRNIHGGAETPSETTSGAPSVPATPPQEVAPTPADTALGTAVDELREQHFTIHYGATCFSYESIVGPYLRGAKSVEIEDPYIRVTHQIQNFVRFCEASLRRPRCARSSS